MRRGTLTRESGEGSLPGWLAGTGSLMFLMSFDDEYVDSCTIWDACPGGNLLGLMGDAKVAERVTEYGCVF